MSVEEQQLRIENVRLREEVKNSFRVPVQNPNPKTHPS
jgi:hypothetical protein